MKQLFYLLVVLSLASCDKFLDVKPKGSLIPKTVEDYDKLLNNASGITAPSFTNLVYMDPDAYMPGGQYNALWRRWWQKQYKWEASTYGDNDDDYDWINRYKFIHVYNEIIHNIDGAELGNVPPSKKQQVKGEAHAQRAMDYFLLVNEYAPAYSNANKDKPAIPMPLVVDLQAQLPRSTVGEVWAQIEADLAIAESLLAGGPARQDKANFRPGMAAVKGLHAMVELYKGEFAKAAQLSDEALAMYSFDYDYNSFSNKTAGNQWSGFTITDFDYSTDCKSVIWNRYSRWTFYDPAQLYAPDLAAKFDKANDRRWILHATTKTRNGVEYAPDYCYARYYAENNVGVTTPDLILVNAEAKARSGKASDAVTALNKLRAKRYVPGTGVYTYTTDAALLAEIKLERRKELYGTGINVLDQKRYHAYGDAVPTFTHVADGVTYTLEPGSNKYVVPICPKVINLNPNLQ